MPSTDRLRNRVPIVQAPMGGGVSTPALAAAVSGAGGLGFVAAGYVEPSTLGAQLREVRARTHEPFGVNVFCPPGPPGDPAEVAAFRARISPTARRHGIEVGAARHHDDAYEEKVALLVSAAPAVVSFTFGCPAAGVVEQLHGAGSEVWATVTDPVEAAQALAAGVDALVAQGAEAGAHRGSFVDDDREPMALGPLVAALRDMSTAVVAAGGLMAGADIARILRAGATAAALGTAFMLCPEAGTSDVHRRAFADDRPTVLTRAFTGRRARGLLNRWIQAFDAGAPRAYPEVHHLTAPLRAHGRTVGDPELVNLWAGTGYRSARALPAAELVHVLATELAAA